MAVIMKCLLDSRTEYSTEEYSPATTVIGAEDLYLYRGCLRVGYAYAPWSGEVDFPPGLVWRTVNMDSHRMALKLKCHTGLSQ
jgi:hypothetical protein